MDIPRFKASLEAAFAAVPYPGDDNITDCGYTKTFGGPCFECREIAEYFRGKPWRGHAITDLRYHESALSLFTEEALQYYLPAFVEAVLDDPQAADVIYDGLIFIFTPSSSPAAEHHVQRLSSAQRSVMIAYFQYCLEERGDYLDGHISQAIVALSA